MLEAKLVLVGGATQSTEIDLDLPTTIGRGRNACVVLRDPSVSRRHCELLEREDRLFVRDLDSRNGTFVGSQRVTESFLPCGELLTIGSFTFRAVYECEANASDSAQIPLAAPPEASKQMVTAGRATVLDDYKEHQERALDPVDETADFAGWICGHIDVEIPARRTMFLDDSNDDSGESSLQCFIQSLE